MDREIMSFLDETGQKIDLEVIEEIKMGKNTYVIMAPIDNEEDAFVYKIVKTPKGEEYREASEEEFEKVLEKYNELFEEE